MSFIAIVTILRNVDTPSFLMWQTVWHPAGPVLQVTHLKRFPLFSWFLKEGEIENNALRDESNYDKPIACLHVSVIKVSVFIYEALLLKLPRNLTRLCSENMASRV